MAKPPVILTPFGAHEVALREIDRVCDERQAAIADSARQLGEASDQVEVTRKASKARAFADYQAALKASH